MELTLSQLALKIDAELAGLGTGRIAAVNAIGPATQTDVTFVSKGKFVPELKNTKAGAVIVSKRIEGLDRPQLIVEDVNAALIKALSIFAPALKQAPLGIDSTAKVGLNVKLGEGISVGPWVIIDDGAEIGDNTILRAGSRIGENSKVGSNCRLDNNVVIYHNCRLGNNVIIQANSTVGSTGFGYALIDGSHKLIPHNGGVVIEDFVEIGANCCIDRAKFGNTIIGAGTKIDNLVQIAHNVTIGKCCLIAGFVGLAGSCKIGNGVVLAGRAGVTDNIEIGDGAMVGASSCLFKNIPAGQQVFGTPATDKNKELRRIASTKRLPQLFEQLKELRTRIEELETAKDNKK